MKGKDTKIARQRRRWNAKSRPNGRLSPYLDTIRGIYRRSASENRGFPSLLRITNGQFYAKMRANMTKPLAGLWSMCYNGYGSNQNSNQSTQGGGLFA